MNNYSPLVSVLVLTYNQEKTIFQTLKSIENQKVSFNFEILIGEDASTDKTREICFKFAKESQIKTRLLPNTKNLGLIKNFVQLGNAVTGKYIALCDGDDFWINTDKLEKQIEILENNDQIGVVHTKFIKLEENTDNESISKEAIYTENQLLDLLKENNIGSSTAAFRTRYFFEFQNEGLFNQGFKMEDYPLWLFISEKSKIHYINECTTTYRVRKESESHSSNRYKSLIFFLL